MPAGSRPAAVLPWAAWLLLAGTAAGLAAAGRAPAATLLVLVVLAPWAEELVFRGGLLEWLLRREVHPALANAATTAAFGLMHGLARSWPLALAVVLPSLLLGLLYTRSRSVPAAAAAHAALNLAWMAIAPAVGEAVITPTSL